MDPYRLPEHRWRRLLNRQGQAGSSRAAGAGEFWIFLGAQSLRFASFIEAIDFLECLGTFSDSESQPPKDDS